MTRQFSVIRQFHPLVALAAFVVFTAPTTPANAAEPRADRQAVAVAYDDLNLTSARGAEVMIRRLERAADAACGVDPHRRGLVPRGERACQKEALGRAVARLNNPLVTIMYAGRDSGKVYAAR